MSTIDVNLSLFMLSGCCFYLFQLTVLSDADQLKVLDNVKSRLSKIMSLNVEVAKLKKQMRINQGVGLSSEDSPLSVNESKLERIEEEIERLSAAKLEVEVGEFSVEEADGSSEIKNSHSQAAQLPTVQEAAISMKKAFSNPVVGPLSSNVNKKIKQQKPQPNIATKTVSKNDTHGKMKTATSVSKRRRLKRRKKKRTNTPFNNGKISRTSVDVKHDLHIIPEGDPPMV